MSAVFRANFQARRRLGKIDTYIIFRLAIIDSAAVLCEWWSIVTKMLDSWADFLCNRFHTVKKKKKKVVIKNVISLVVNQNAVFENL